MNSFSLDSIINSPFSETIKLYWNELVAYLTGTTVIIRENNRILTVVVEQVPNSLCFDDFQWKLLKGFTLIFIINVFLIIIAWKLYGKNICERFMKPATSKAIEELKASVSKLKLPKEHTPRI